MLTKNIIGNWFNNGKKSDNSYNKFIYLWFSFNAFYYDSSIDSENKQLKAIWKKYNENFEKNDFKGTGIEEFFNFQKERERSDGGVGGVIRLDKNTIITYESITNLKDFILIVYQIRCNLFHGGKMMGRENDDELVRKASFALEEFLEKILEFDKYEL